MERMVRILAMGMVLCAIAAGNAWSAENPKTENPKP